MLPDELRAGSVRERLLIVISVVLVHAMLLWYWMVMPEAAISVPHEMSVSISVPPPAVLQAEPKVAPRAVAQVAPKTAPPQVKSDEPRLVAPAIAPAIAAPAAPAVKPAAEVTASASAPRVQPDSEPDYKASYLHNPHPVYPMVARRMGWEGRVILSVEVLAEGSCGAVVVYRSSGHEVLDNAAMNTVKTWRFTPARHVGNAVTQWFKVPVNFSLEDNEA